MPTAATTTFSNDRLLPYYAGVPHPQQEVKLANGTYAKGTLLGEVTATPGTFAAYATAAVDGTGVARCILEYACVVAAGVITGIDEFSGGALPTAPAFFGGAFRTEDLVGLDADAIVDLGGHLASGTTSAGVLVF